MSRHIHLDTIGGISGDMFVAAMLDFMPAGADELQDVISLAGFPDMVEVTLDDHNDGVLAGSVFRVTQKQSPGAGSEEPTRHHPHRHYREIRTLLEASSLDQETATTALGIFHLLAQAEATVHGKDLEDVAFHEVGAWDSITDIVLAAWLITRSGADSWSVSSLPSGNGQVSTAHGSLPVPVPAVTNLLQGFHFHDDGLAGERVTPTGAAILAYLVSAGSRPSGVLTDTGYGFGSHSFEGLSNVLRVTAYETEAENAPGDWETGRITELAFETDDQRPEDLAHALETIRGHEGVFDVLNYPGQGKKGRPVHCVRVLCSNESALSVTTLCFNETTTLGIREQQVSRHMLQRMLLSADIDGQTLRVKLAQRPSGAVTLKSEMDDLAKSGLDHAGREQLRIAAEQAILDQLADAGDDESENE